MKRRQLQGNSRRK